jgi:hypothetical protein
MGPFLLPSLASPDTLLDLILLGPGRRLAMVSPFQARALLGGKFVAWQK